MNFFDTIRTAVFEVFMEKHGAGGAVIRLIAFETDEDTGARSVADIVEFDYDNESGKKWVTRLAAEYTENSATDVEYFIRATETPAGGISGENIALDDIDTGRARKLQSRLVKAIDSVVAEHWG